VRMSICLSHGCVRMCCNIFESSMRGFVKKWGRRHILRDLAAERAGLVVEWFGCGLWGGLCVGCAKVCSICLLLSSFRHFCALFGFILTYTSLTLAPYYNHHHRQRQRHVVRVQSHTFSLPASALIGHHQHQHQQP
jgi:hypothetical protein